MTTSAEAAEARVHAVLEEYMAQLRAGRAPDRAAILARDPDLAESLAASFRALDFVHAAGATLEPPAGPPGDEEPTGAGRLLGDYRLLRELGRGGMAVVYEAEQLSLGRHVALKVLPFAAVLDPKHLQRFKNEAQAAAHLNHPHIVPVHAVGCERGVHYYAMQYVEGQSLAVAIREMKGGGVGEGPRTPISSHGSNRQSGYIRMAAALGMQAAAALDHAHQLGIVHRDVKPGNLLVDLAGELWITDFGLSQSIKDVGLTITGELLGTIRYMSPEQALAKRAPIDHRTDVYSLGATLYELFTLEPAFPGEDPHLVIQDITFKEPVRPRRLNPSLPRDVETVLLKAMSKDPAGRYATAQEMADDLARFLENRPVEAKRPGLLRRVAKWSLRHRAVVGIAAGTLLLGVLGLAAGATLLWRERERTSHEKEQAKAGFERAEANLKLALKALDEIFVDDAEGLPRIRESLPRDMLQRGLGFYEALARENADNQHVADFVGRARIAESRICGELGEEARAAEAINEAIAIYREIALRWPEDPVPHNNLGIALAVKGDMDEAMREYREAIRLGPGPADAHYNLGNALFERDMDGAIREYREAIRAQPDHASAYFNLANALRAKGDLEGAIRAAREVVRLEPNEASAHLSLGIKLSFHGDLDEAAVELRAAIRLGPDDPGAHCNLGSVLLDAGDAEAALGEFREAMRLAPEAALPHYGAGNAFLAMDAPDEAIREFGEAVRIQPGFAEALGNLGAALLRKGRFAEAIPPLRRACELGSDRPNWNYPSKEDVLAAERMAALEGRLESVLSGAERPAALDRIGFAEVLYAKSRHAESARMYAEAFAEDETLAEDPSTGRRYNAACSASLASARGGADAAGWRCRALEWLRADLAQGPPAATLKHWKRDPDLAGVRDHLDDLPEGEREGWAGLWADVDVRARVK